MLIAVPIGWFASEFQPRRWLRLILGVLSILMALCVAVFLNVLDRFQYNADYGFASKELIDAAVLELEAGNRDRVLRSLKDLQGRFKPTYENRANYTTLVNETVKSMRSPDSKAP